MIIACVNNYHPPTHTDPSIDYTFLLRSSHCNQTRHQFSVGFSAFPRPLGGPRQRPLQLEQASWVGDAVQAGEGVCATRTMSFRYQGRPSRTCLRRFCMSAPRKVAVFVSQLARRVFSPPPMAKRRLRRNMSTSTSTASARCAPSQFEGSADRALDLICPVRNIL